MRKKTDAQNKAPVFVRGGWVDKSRHGLTLLNVVSRRMPVRAQATVPHLAKDADASTQVGRHCIVLHGWASSGVESRDLWASVRTLPEAASWHFWDVSYDSQWTTFDESARRIVAALRREAVEFSDAILIGNSMGGVVARQMVALGFPCRALLSICSPHYGPAPWIPVPSRGPRSIAPRSHLLARLNRDPVDMAHRHRYHFFAITYEDALGHHEHDGIILASSALGLGLGPVAHRERIHLRYRTVATFDAHWRGRFAAHIPPVVETLRALMKGSNELQQTDTPRAAAAQTAVAQVETREVVSV
ncbi:MAG TPA: alpha/beta hydrolase [Abditibacteriaceae bacterium]|jgi:pimeloyl-ACP methyl ester carboxylesterase